MALPLPYTHGFKFQVGDGGSFIEGLIEFNTDGKVSFRLDESSQPLNNEVLKDFIALTELLKTIYQKHSGIKLIKFIDKEE